MERFLGRRQRLLEQMRRQTLAMREQQYRVLVREYRPTANRLNAAYANLQKNLEARLVALEDEKTLERDSASVRRLLGELNDDLETMASIIDEEAAKLQTSGFRTGVRMGEVNLNSAGVRGVRFGQTAIETIRAGFDYVDSAAFRDVVGEYASHHVDKIADTIGFAIQRGLNPRQTARLIREYMEGSNPRADAERLTRTTQLYAARQGTRGIYEAVGTRFWIWIANIGNPRTCMACIAQHGTRHPISEILNDHHNGRCAMAPLTPTWAELGFEDGQDVGIESGLAWFERQDQKVQQQIMGRRMWGEWKAEKFELSPDTLTTTYQNPIFGEMRRRKSLAEVLAYTE